MNTKPRLVAIDLDGTMLRRDKSIGPETVAAVNAALAQGTQVLICTGRSRVQSERFLPLFPEMRYIITSSGAAVYDIAGGMKKIISNEISPQLALEILALADTLDCFPIMSVEGKTVYTAGLKDAAPDYGLAAYTYEINTFGTGVSSVSGWYRENPQPVESLSLYFRDRDLCLQVVEQLKHLPLYFALPGEPAVEISLNSANKGAALEALCGMLNMPMTDTMAIGDSDNDLPMMTAAGFAVASGNAPEPVKAHAHYVTADCDHDGVARVLERFILK